MIIDAGDSSTVQFRSSGASASEVIVRHLAARTTYELRLASVNALGQGPFSTPTVTLSTAEEAPAYRPQEVRAHALSSHTLRVQWRGPQHLNLAAPIKGYYVGYRKLLSPAGDSSPAGGTPTATIGQSRPRDQSSADFDTSAISNQTGSQLAAFATVETNNGHNNGGAAAQQQTDDNLNSVAAMQSGNQANNINSVHEYTIHNLERNTRYEIKLQAYNGAGTGPPVETHAQTLKFDRPDAPVVRVIGARRSSIEIRWQQPQASGAEQPIAGYSIFYKCEYDEWQEVQLGPISAHVLDNLRCGTKYQIYVSAFNAAGRSDPSDVVLARTDGSVPVAPDKDQLIRVNITQATLELGAWQSGGCPVTNFMIQYKKTTDSNWFVVSDSIVSNSNQQQQRSATIAAAAATTTTTTTTANPTPTVTATATTTTNQMITISDLTPATWYKLLMTAANEAGATNAEYMFGTLTPGGATIPLPAGMSSTSSSSLPNHSTPGGAGELLHWLVFELNFVIPLTLLVVLVVCVGALLMHLSSVYSSSSGGSSSGGSSSSCLSTTTSGTTANHHNHNHANHHSAIIGSSVLGNVAASVVSNNDDNNDGANNKHQFVHQFGHQLHQHLLRAARRGSTPVDSTGDNYHVGANGSSQSSQLATRSTVCLATDLINQQPNGATLHNHNTNLMSAQYNNATLPLHLHHHRASSYQNAQNVQNVQNSQNAQNSDQIAIPIYGYAPTNADPSGQVDAANIEHSSYGQMRMIVNDDSHHYHHSSTLADDRCRDSSQPNTAPACSSGLCNSFDLSPYQQLHTNNSSSLSAAFMAAAAAAAIADAGAANGKTLAPDTTEPFGSYSTHHRAHTLHRDSNFANVRLICHPPPPSIHNNDNQQLIRQQQEQQLEHCDLDGYSRVTKRVSNEHTFDHELGPSSSALVGAYGATLGHCHHSTTTSFDGSNR